MPPPPPLPAPGEQPVDVDTARAAVAAAVSAVFTGKTDESTLMNLIDDPHDLPAVRDALLAGGFAAQVRDAKVEVGEMVFTAPDRAAVRITIVVSLGRFDSVSEVRLVEGTWKVARASYCAAVNLAGVECPT